MAKCDNISNCEWWFCRENNLCLLDEHEKRGKPTIEIAFPSLRNTTTKESPPQQKKKVNKAPKEPVVIKGNRLLVYERDNYKCVFCGSGHELTLDHIWPKSKGGKRSIKNLQTLCKKCNGYKGNMEPEIFLLHLRLVMPNHFKYMDSKEEIRDKIIELVKNQISTRNNNNNQE